ncbi:hypothetical protein ACLOJK_026813, partial [Asimina triloba]
SKLKGHEQWITAAMVGHNHPTFNRNLHHQKGQARDMQMQPHPFNQGTADDNVQADKDSSSMGQLTAISKWAANRGLASWQIRDGHSNFTAAAGYKRDADKKHKTHQVSKFGGGEKHFGGGEKQFGREGEQRGSFIRPLHRGGWDTIRF